MIDIVGLRGFRRDVRKSGDPDETEGRMIYRARAEGEARMSIARAIRVRLLP